MIEFINLVSSQANEVCNKKQRNKINSEHLFEALQELGFSEYIEDMKTVGDEVSSGVMIFSFCFVLADISIEETTYEKEQV